MRRPSRAKRFRSHDHPGLLLTIQVAPDDCTGCGVCVDVCPAKSKSETKHKAIEMEPIAEHLDRERARFEAFLHLRGRARRAPRSGIGEGLPGPRAAVRVLGRVRRMRRDPLPQAPHPALRRPRARRERDRLLVDLRRQPADDPVGDRRGRARPCMVELALRGQRRVRARDAHRPRPSERRGPTDASPSSSRPSARTS